MAVPEPVPDTSASSTQSKLPSSHRLPTVSASEALLELQSHGPASAACGVRSLDTLLQSGVVSGDGGFERGKVTEIWGPCGAGKTAVLLQTAVQALIRGQHVVWVDGDTPLQGPRLRSVLEHTLATTEGSSPTSSLQDCIIRFHHRVVPTLSHLLAMTMHAPPKFPPEGASLLVISGLNTLIDLDYPRFPFASSNKTEQQRWQTGRRYAVLGSFVSALNKLAVLKNLAVIVTTGCASRMRNDSGLRSALVPGVGGGEWDAGVWTRLVVFRDFSGRCVGMQKCQGRSLISREEIGEVGRVIGVAVTEQGGLFERTSLKGIVQTLPEVISSPVKPRKRTYDEVADSDGEDADEYGWADKDEDALA